MQYLFPVFVGPSWKICPKWEPHFAHKTSVLSMPLLLSCAYLMLPGKASSKLGQPVPESNLASEENNWLPQAEHLYIPLPFSWTYLPVKGGSVPFSRIVLYCPGVNDPFQFSSLLGACLLGRIIGCHSQILKNLRMTYKLFFSNDANFSWTFSNLGLITTWQ